MMSISEVRANVLLQQHLQHNHIPPFPDIMIEVAKVAIAAYDRGGYTAKVNLFRDFNVIHRRYGGVVFAGLLVDDLRLHAFVD